MVTLFRYDGRYQPRPWKRHRRKQLLAWIWDAKCLARPSWRANMKLNWISRGYRRLQVPTSQLSDAETTPLGLQTLGKACQRSTTVDAPCPTRFLSSIWMNSGEICGLYNVKYRAGITWRAVTKGVPAGRAPSPPLSPGGSSKRGWKRPKRNSAPRFR